MYTYVYIYIYIFIYTYVYTYCKEICSKIMKMMPSFNIQQLTFLVRAAGAILPLGCRTPGSGALRRCAS